MDSLATYRQIIRDVLIEYTKVPYAYGHIEFETVFDPSSDRYLLMTVGWVGDRRVHGSLIHIDLIDSKVWIQRDGTEYGVARDLEAAGIPKEHIVLGFQPVDVRPFTEYAVA